MSERKKEEARRRAKSVSDNARWARKTGTTRQRTPGVKIVGAPLFSGPDDSKKTAGESLESIVLSYILRKDGIKITDQTKIPAIYRKIDTTDVSEVMIARILGPDEK